MFHAHRMNQRSWSTSMMALYCFMKGFRKWPHLPLESRHYCCSCFGDRKSEGQHTLNNLLSFNKQYTGKPHSMPMFFYYNSTHILNLKCQSAPSPPDAYVLKTMQQWAEVNHLEIPWIARAPTSFSWSIKGFTGTLGFGRGAWLIALELVWYKVSCFALLHVPNIMRRLPPGQKWQGQATTHWNLCNYAWKGMLLPLKLVLLGAIS